MNAGGKNTNRVVSGMRPTGPLHLGHLHGVLNNWTRLQFEYECFFFVADWHALTTHYDDPADISKHTWQTVIDWLAAGVNPEHATLFIQSRVPEHAELHLLLSMITPLGWLERVPTYKDQQEMLREKDLATYGFLGYPLLQSADILIYRAAKVPVGEDQVAHVEMTREVARRFNHLFGREPGFEERAQKAVRKLGAKNAKVYEQARRRYQEQGDAAALEVGHALLDPHPNLTVADRERLLGFLEGGGRSILEEPAALLTPVPKMPGIDGQKMSKSYGNAIHLREDADSVSKKLKTMQTDPARVRRTDPGTPEKCPVWGLHKVYSDTGVQDWVQKGCTTAAIGCLDCKKPLIDKIQAELDPIRERGAEYEQSPDLVRNLVAAGNEKARDEARDTLVDVRAAMGLK